MDPRIIPALTILLLKCILGGSSDDVDDYGFGGGGGGGSEFDYSLYDDDDFDPPTFRENGHDFTMGVCSYKSAFKFKCDISRWNRILSTPPATASSSSSSSSTTTTKSSFLSSRFESIMEIACDGNNVGKKVACSLDRGGGSEEEKLTVYFYVDAILGWFRGNLSALLSLGAGLLRCESPGEDRLDCGFLVLMNNATAQGDIWCFGEERTRSQSYFVRCKVYEARLLAKKFLEIAVNLSLRMDERVQADVRIRVGKFLKNYKILVAQVGARLYFYATECHDGPDETCEGILGELESKFNDVAAFGAEYQVDEIPGPSSSEVVEDDDDDDDDDDEEEDGDEEEDEDEEEEEDEEENKTIGVFGTLFNASAVSSGLNRTLNFHLNLPLFGNVTVACETTDSPTDNIVTCTTGSNSKKDSDKSHRRKKRTSRMNITTLFRFSTGSKMISFDAAYLIRANQSHPFLRGTTVSHCNLTADVATLTCNLAIGNGSNIIDGNLTCIFSMETEGKETHFDCTMNITGAGGRVDGYNIPGNLTHAKGRTNVTMVISGISRKRLDVSCHFVVNPELPILASLKDDNRCDVKLEEVTRK